MSARVAAAWRRQWHNVLLGVGLALIVGGELAFYFSMPFGGGLR